MPSFLRYFSFISNKKISDVPYQRNLSEIFYRIDLSEVTTIDFYLIININNPISSIFSGLFFNTLYFLFCNQVYLISYLNMMRQSFGMTFEFYKFISRLIHLVFNSFAKTKDSYTFNLLARIHNVGHYF